MSVITWLFNILVCLFLGYLVGAWHERKFANRRRPRNQSVEEKTVRDDEARYRFEAFRDLYQNYSDHWLGHYLAEENLRDSRIALRESIAQRFRRQDLIYQQAGIDVEDLIDSICERAVRNAAPLFLSI
jgi:hypothetical protein